MEQPKSTGLTHVCKITDNGSVRVTPRDMPSCTIRAKDKALFCDLCGSYVTFAHGPKKQFFRHESKERNQCPEYTKAHYKIADPYLHFNQVRLPLRIVNNYNKSGIHFELGMLPLPVEVTDKNGGSWVQIDGITLNEKSQSVFRFQIADYIINGEISYIDIGQKLFKEYKISVPDSVQGYWPAKTKGLDFGGTLFDKKSGRMVMPNGRVEVGKEYYLVYNSHKMINYNDQIECKDKAALSNSWIIVTVKALKFTQGTATFFLDFHARLNEQTPCIAPLWPPCVVKSDIFHYKNEGHILFFMYSYNDFHIETWPRIGSSRLESPCGYSLLNLYVSYNQQLVSIGYTGVIQYLYLWKDQSRIESEIQNPKIDITVTNESGGSLSKDFCFELPKEVYIKSEYDGYALLTEKGFVKYKIVFKDNRTVTIRNKIHFGEQLQIYIGRDCVQTIAFLRKSRKLNNMDSMLAKSLLMSNGENTAVPHSLGAVAVALPEYEETQKILRTFIRQGYIPVHALRILRNFLTRKLENG